MINYKYQQYEEHDVHHFWSQMMHFFTKTIFELRNSEVLNFGISTFYDESAKVFESNGHQLPSDVASYPRRTEISTVIICSKF